MSVVVAKRDLGSYLFHDCLGQDTHLCQQQGPLRDCSCHCAEIARTHDVGEWAVIQVLGDLVLRLVLSSAGI